MPLDMLIWILNLVVIMLEMEWLSGWLVGWCISTKMSHFDQ